MFTRIEAEKLGFRIEFNDQEGTFRSSHDGGLNWSRWHSLYNSKSDVLKQKLGHFYVNQVLKPELKQGEYLCHICANRGKIGIVKFAGYTTGTEMITVERWEGDYNYTEDVAVGCRYAQWKCTICGHLADSEYA